jgi:hypothetical protein
MNKNAVLAHYTSPNPWFGWDESGVSHVCSPATTTTATVAGPWDGSTITETRCTCGALTRLIDRG